MTTVARTIIDGRNVLSTTCTHEELSLQLPTLPLTSCGIIEGYIQPCVIVEMYDLGNRLKSIVRVNEVLILECFNTTPHATLCQYEHEHLNWAILGQRLASSVVPYNLELFLYPSYAKCAILERWTPRSDLFWGCLETDNQEQEDMFEHCAFVFLPSAAALCDGHLVSTLWKRTHNRAATLRK